MVTEKMGSHKNVAHWQGFGCLKTDEKKRLSSRVSGSQKQDCPPNLDDDLFMVFVMRDVEDEVKE